MIGPIDAVEPHANRAIVFIFEGKNPVRMHGLTADCDDTSCGGSIGSVGPDATLVY